jgi:hypothetical protein
MGKFSAKNIQKTSARIIQKIGKQEVLNYRNTLKNTKFVVPVEGKK